MQQYNRRNINVFNGNVFDRNGFDEMDAFNDFFTDPFDDFLDDSLDAMIDLATQGPRRLSNPVRAISPWTSLLNQSVQALQTAMAQLRPPTNMRGFTNALYRAEGLLSRAGAEVRRVMSGTRRAAVLDQLSNAAIRISVARAAAGGRSALIPGGQSLMPPDISVQGAINHIRAAQNAIGLRIV